MTRFVRIMLCMSLLAFVMRAETPFLGVATRGLTPGESGELPPGIGLRVVEVVPDSPAELELEPGDIFSLRGGLDSCECSTTSGPSRSRPGEGSAAFMSPGNLHWRICVSSISGTARFSRRREW